MKKVKINLNRTKLNEGRARGISLAYCKKTSRTKLEEIMPLSPCKDYLSDVIWSERTNKESEVYGFYYTPTGCLNPVYNYMTVGMLEDNKEDSITGNCSNAQIKKFKNSVPNMLSFINTIEENLRVPKTKLIESNLENRILIRNSSFWSKYPYLISLYGLLLRESSTFTPGQNEFEFLEVLDDTYCNKIIYKLKYLYSVRKLPYQEVNLSLCKSIHNVGGIVNFNFPSNYTNKIKPHLK